MTDPIHAWTIKAPDGKLCLGAMGATPDLAFFAAEDPLAGLFRKQMEERGYRAVPIEIRETI